MNAERLHDLIELEFGSPMTILSKALRSMFVAAPGRILCGADYSNVEGRVNAWICGEEWKIRAFKEFDAGTGPDLYKLAYSRSFGVPIEEVKKPQRQIGKTQELALSFGGSIGAWLRFDPVPITVTKLVSEQFRGTDSWRKAEEQYDRARHHYDLTPDQWISIKVVVNGWREANSNITQSWWALADAAVEAVDQRGNLVSLLDGKVQYLASDGFLWCRTPSGKLLAYASPQLVETREEWLVDADGEAHPAEEFDAEEIAARVAAGATLESGRARTQVMFQGKNMRTGVWGRQRLYGGLQNNNVVQSTARELLREGMLRVEAAGYPIVLHCHDEVVSEIDEGCGSVGEYEALMSTVPSWAEGLPLVAKGWLDRRYVK